MTSVPHESFYDQPDVLHQDLNLVNNADECHCYEFRELAMVDESFVNENAYCDSSM